MQVVLGSMKKWMFASAVLLTALCSCGEKTITLDAPPLADYFPTTVGKFITYRIDSTIPTQFGADTTVRSYRVRDQYDAEITDGLGRKAFRVFRSISNVAGTAPYVPNNTFTATPVGTQWVEWMENNLRFMKLRAPIEEGFRWKGHSFIDATSINSPVRYLADWEFDYRNVGQPFTVGGKTYPNTVTVFQRDEVLPEGPFNPGFYKQWNYGIEVYAKGVGLIYKNFDHKVWQPPSDPPAPRPGYWEDGSYRVVLTAIDHN